MLINKNEIILSKLEPKFADKINSILNNCKNTGVEIELREGERNTFTQAVYWRRSRSDKDVQEQIKALQNDKADFLAYCLFVVGEQQGTHATNAIPGLSWHQYGLAVDCAWILNSKVCWDNENLYDGINGYEVLAREAKKLDVCSGHEWVGFRDSGHLQANFYSSPLEVYSLATIDELMEERYLSLLENKF